ncbi:MAG: rhodanese-like domain-containing protein [Sandaracinaceae bacterium]
MRTITTEELHAIHEDPKGTILDVRTPAEFSEGHIPGAVNIPHGDVAARLAEVPSDAPVYVHCKMGGRAQKAAAVLEAAGHDVVCVASGGMNAWTERGFPTA